MPYIKQDRRDTLNPSIEGLLDKIHTDGELNYTITKIALNYINATTNGKPNYGSINAVVGALECAKLELYRRLAGPYEDVKIKENGDVYD